MTEKGKYEMPMLKRIKLDESELTLSVYSGKNNEQWYDVRTFANGFPTTKGVRLRRKTLLSLIDVFEELGDLMEEKVPKVKPKKVKKDDDSLHTPPSPPREA
jgi:hypothetical protein